MTAREDFYKDSGLVFAASPSSWAGQEADYQRVDDALDAIEAEAVRADRPDVSTREAASIVSTPDTVSGAARFGGTRLPILSVMGLLNAHREIGPVEDAYPSLPEGWFDLLLALSPCFRREYRNALRQAKYARDSGAPSIYPVDP
jgi:uncharacterized protein (DUF433 family)